jgi:aspartyl-tRNA(Asn)/glutamyl-tRNA(Gln) amidotransferase subunit B
LNGRSLQDFLAHNLPELPAAAQERLKRDYSLDDYTASVIAGDPPAIRIYDDAVETARKQVPGHDSGTIIPQTVANFLCNDLFSLIREDEERRRDAVGEVVQTALGKTASTAYSNVTGPQLGELISLLLQGTISTTMAKKLLVLLYIEEVGGVPSEVAKNHGLQLISDPFALQQLCRATIAEYPDQVGQYRKGGKNVSKVKKFLVGKAMASSQGNAHPERLHEALDYVLEEVASGVQ